jgi:hypothetical protein
MNIIRLTISTKLKPLWNIMGIMVIITMAIITTMATTDEEEEG